MRIGITGHSNLSSDTLPLVAAALRTLLTDSLSPIIGVSCLARGTDQVFARAVLDLGGELEVVLPASDYRERKVKPSNAANFDDLIGKAAKVITLPFEQSNRDAYMAASERVLATVDSVVAVWDGPARRRPRWHRRRCGFRQAAGAGGDCGLAGRGRIGSESGFVGRRRPWTCGSGRTRSSTWSRHVVQRRGGHGQERG